jgi:hypothetical protein
VLHGCWTYGQESKNEVDEGGNRHNGAHCTLVLCTTRVALGQDRCTLFRASNISGATKVVRASNISGLAIGLASLRVTDDAEHANAADDEQDSSDGVQDPRLHITQQASTSPPPWRVVRLTTLFADVLFLQQLQTTVAPAVKQRAAATTPRTPPASKSTITPMTPQTMAATP